MGGGGGGGVGAGPGGWVGQGWASQGVPSSSSSPASQSELPLPAVLASRRMNRGRALRADIRAVLPDEWVAQVRCHACPSALRCTSLQHPGGGGHAGAPHGGCRLPLPTCSWHGRPALSHLPWLRLLSPNPPLPTPCRPRDPPSLHRPASWTRWRTGPARGWTWRGSCAACWCPTTASWARRPGGWAQEGRRGRGAALAEGGRHETKGTLLDCAASAPAPTRAFRPHCRHPAPTPIPAACSRCRPRA